MELSEQLFAAVNSGALSRVIETFLSLPQTWAGTPRSADRLECAGIIVHSLPGDQARAWGTVLSHHSAPACRELGLSVLEGCLEPAQLAATAAGLAADPHWCVRELVAFASGRALATCPSVTPIIAGWTKSESPWLVRAGIVAVRAALAGRSYPFESACRLLEPALGVWHEYVRRNLGPYAIGDGTLRVYPSAAIEWLNDLADRPCEVTRWNVAMAFTAAAGLRQPEAAEVILEALSVDQRPIVTRAVTAAIVRLARTHPGFEGVLSRWRDDPQRAHVAKAAGKRLVR